MAKRKRATTSQIAGNVDRPPKKKTASSATPKQNRNKSQSTQDDHISSGVTTRTDSFGHAPDIDYRPIDQLQLHADIRDWIKGFELLRRCATADILDRQLFESFRRWGVILRDEATDDDDSEAAKALGYLLSCWEILECVQSRSDLEITGAIRNLDERSLREAVWAINNFLRKYAQGPIKECREIIDVVDIDGELYWRRAADSVVNENSVSGLLEKKSNETNFLGISFKNGRLKRQGKKHPGVYFGGKRGSLIAAILASGKRGLTKPEAEAAYGSNDNALSGALTKIRKDLIPFDLNIRNGKYYFEDASSQKK